MIIKVGNTLRFGEFEALHQEIPKAVWLLKYDGIRKEFYLSQQSDFTLPPKIYGNPEVFVNRVLKTYTTVEDSVGVLLEGLKGTGKTITAKMLAMKSDLPVVCINESFVDDDVVGTFKEFVNSINEEVVIFIDEFEKTYEYRQQQVFLDILDGANSSKKLYIFTSNSDSVNEFLTNRLKRIRYRKSYDNISDDVFEEVVEHLLNIKSHKEELKQVLTALGISTLDILISIIEEMNIHEVNPKEAIKDLNLINEKVLFDIYVKSDKDEWGWEDTAKYSMSEINSGAMVTLNYDKVELSKATINKVVDGFIIKSEEGVEYYLKQKLKSMLVI